jgi:hypothetical protein
MRRFTIRIENRIYVVQHDEKGYTIFNSESEVMVLKAKIDKHLNFSWSTDADEKSHLIDRIGQIIEHYQP